MGKRNVVGAVEVELVNAEGDGYLIEVGAKYYYDSERLEIDYAYDLQTAAYIDKSTLSLKDTNEVINELCRSGQYFEDETDDSCYELSMDK